MLCSQCFMCVSGGGDLKQASWPRAVPLCHMHIVSGCCLVNPFLPFSVVDRERHFCCEDCNGNVSGGFDASMSQVGIFVELSSFLHF